jgi:hypothetical protein
MWIGGDLIFLAAILALVLDWSRREERETVAQERRADLARAEIRVREERLARRQAGGDSGQLGRPWAQARPATDSVADPPLEPATDPVPNLGASSPPGGASSPR